MIFGGNGIFTSEIFGVSNKIKMELALAPAPGQDIIIDNYTIYNNGLDVDANDRLIVNDTLIVYGNLMLGNNADLIINDGAVCIVYGDVEITNKIVLSFNSYFVVTGNLVHNGSATNVDLEVDENASIYILGDVDENFPTMVCDQSTTSSYVPPGDSAICERGDIISLEDNENNEGGLYDWIVNNDSLKGVTPVYSELCGVGDDVTISALFTDGVSYQWCDSSSVHLSNETNINYTATDAGEYFVKIFDGTDTIYSHRAKVVMSNSVDNEDPTFTCPADIIVGLNNDCKLIVPDLVSGILDESDNCV